jgi:hypothetical protein
MAELEAIFHGMKHQPPSRSTVETRSMSDGVCSSMFTFAKVALADPCRVPFQSSRFDRRSSSCQAEQLAGKVLFQVGMGERGVR